MSNDFKIFYEFFCFLILAGAFAFGVIKLFKKEKPLYFQMYVMLCGCRMLEKLIFFATLLCEISSPYISTASFFGVFSAALFSLSANKGVLDRVVDDKSDPDNKKARRLGLIAPAVMIVLIGIVVLLNLQKGPVFNAIVLAVATLPCIPASYYNFKHILLKDDEMGFLKTTRWLNVIVLTIFITGMLYNYANLMFPDTSIGNIIECVVILLTALEVAVSVKGSKQWKI